MPRLRIALLALAVLAFPLSHAVADDGPHKHHAGDSEKLGTVGFSTSCSPAAHKQFTRALAMLHSFWYPEAHEAFQQVVKTEPDCAIGYWGVAMSLYHPLWEPARAADIKEANEALEKAKAAKKSSERERAYLAAIAAYYRDADKLDHPTRAKAWSAAMEKLHADYPKDDEAAIFYALSLLGTAQRTDMTYTNQKKAAAILEKVWPAHRDHPGVAHLLIHSYDSSVMAQYGLEAARAYAKIAPSAAHALHMPSHIFSRLGLWEESMKSNIASADAAAKYTAQGKPSYGDEVHALDFLMNAYMQMRDLEAARGVIARLRNLGGSEAGRRTGAYATVVIPARYLVEQGLWRDAAEIPREGEGSTLAYVHWIRGVGAARTGKLDQAREEMAGLAKLVAKEKADPDSDYEEEFESLRLTVAAWIAKAEGNTDEALRLMRQSADTFEGVTSSYAPIPPREHLAEMLAGLGKHKEALAEYEATLAKRPGRFNSIFGAAKEAAEIGDQQKANSYLVKLRQQAPKWMAVASLGGISPRKTKVEAMWACPVYFDLGVLTTLEYNPLRTMYQ